jgi:hypothetical protein
MHAILPFLLFASPSASQTAASSTGLSYSYVELGFAMVQNRSNPDGGSGGPLDDTESLGGTVSYSLNETFFAQGSLNVYVDNERGYKLGLGARHPLSNEYVVDAYALAGLASWDLENQNARENGLALEIGFRAMVAESVEIQTYLSLVDIFDQVSTLGGDIRFHATESFSLGLSVASSDNDDSMGLGIRFGF